MLCNRASRQEKNGVLYCGNQPKGDRIIERRFRSWWRDSRGGANSFLINWRAFLKTHSFIGQWHRATWEVAIFMKLILIECMLKNQIFRTKVPSKCISNYKRLARPRHPVYCFEVNKKNIHIITPRNIKHPNISLEEKVQSKSWRLSQLHSFQ